MDNKEFDKLISGAIERLEKSRFKPEWEAFERNSLNPLSDDEFDRVIHEKLSGSGPGYRHSHWLSYLNRAALVQLFKVDLVYNKAFEGFLLGLALLWIFPVFQSDTNPISEAFEIAYLPAGDIESINFQNFFNSDYLVFSHTFQGNTAKGIKHSEVKISNPLPITGTENDLVEAFSSVRFYPVEEAFKSVQKSEGQTSYIKTLVSLPINLLPGNDKDNWCRIKSARLKDPLVISQVLPNGTIRALDFSEIHLENKIAVKDQNQPLRKKEKFQWVFSSFMAADVNTIHTPYDEIYQQRGYEQSKFGMGGGFSAGLMRNGWMLELGMIYSMKQYNPQSVLEVFRFRNETARAVSLKSIELNTFSIPLNIRYDFVSKGRWIPHVKMGLGLNVATHANYEREEYILALRAPLPPGANLNVSEEPKLDEKRFTDGILQGGKFSENSYLSANSALGIDYVLTPKWRIYKQVSYHYNFLETKLGPNNDHINTFSIQLGVRYLPD